MNRRHFGIEDESSTDSFELSNVLINVNINISNVRQKLG